MNGKREEDGPRRVLDGEGEGGGGGVGGGDEMGKKRKGEPTPHLKSPSPPPTPRKEIRRPLHICLGHFHMLYSSNQNN